MYTVSDGLRLYGMVEQDGFPWRVGWTNDLGEGHEVRVDAQFVRGMKNVAVAVFSSLSREGLREEALEKIAEARERP